jgi:hypothetical protein
MITLFRFAAKGGALASGVAGSTGRAYKGSVTHRQPCSPSEMGRTTTASAVCDSSAIILINCR